VAVRVGPVSARFRGNLQMTNVVAPNRYTINFEGQGGVAGLGKGSADVALAPEGGDKTRLTYAAKAQVGGKLAQVGSRLIDAAAGKITDDFFKAFEGNLEARGLVAGSGRATSAVVESTGTATERRAVGALGWALVVLVGAVALYLVLR
jgi:hypothetical protein